MSTPVTKPNTNTQIVPRTDKAETIRVMLEKSKPQIALALPRHLNADRMLRIAMTSVRRTPDLLACTPQSLCGAVIQAAQLGLEPDGVLGHAYLVPFKDTCTLIVGYRGYIDLARRSGQVSTIYARAVYAADQFDYSFGLDETLQHIPTRDAEPGEIVYVYAVIKMKDGGIQFDVMNRREIDAIRARSASANKGPWVTDFAEMAKKSILRRVCKMAPLSVEVARAVALDERADLGLSQQLEDVVDAQLVEPTVKPSLDSVVAAEGATS